MKWFEFKTENEPSIGRYLDCVAKNSGAKIELESSDLYSSVTLEEIRVLTRGHDFIWVSPGLKLKPRELFAKMPSEVFSSNELDGIVIDGDHLWPTLFGRDVLMKFIASEIGVLNRHAAALIAGQDIFPSATAMALSQLGFKKIHLVSVDRDKAEAYLEEWRRSFFGIDWVFEDTSTLTQEASRFSIVMSLVGAENEVLRNLYYFNFLRPGGVVIDMSPGGVDVPLIREALETEARAFSGHQILAHRLNSIVSHFGLGSCDIPKLIADFDELAD